MGERTKKDIRLNSRIGATKDKSKTISGGGNIEAEIPITESITIKPYIEGWAAKGPWGSAKGISEYGGSLEFSFKKGGKVKKCKRDGIAMRGKTKAGR